MQDQFAPRTSKMAAMQFVTDCLPSGRVVIFVLATLGLLLFAKIHLNPLAKLPGPWYSKYTDVVLKRLWLGGSKTQYVHALHKKYGESIQSHTSMQILKLIRLLVRSCRPHQSS